MLALLASLWQMTWADSDWQVLLPDLPPAPSAALPAAVRRAFRTWSARPRLTVRRFGRNRFRPRITMAAGLDRVGTLAGWWDPPLRPAFGRPDLAHLIGAADPECRRTISPAPKAPAQPPRSIWQTIGLTRPRPASTRVG